MKKINKNQIQDSRFKILTSGFTLVELLVVIAILGILATIGLETFASSQARGRDAERKSDLKQISSSLELFYSDYGKYPLSNNGAIEGCRYNPVNGSGINCVWGSTSSTGDFTDGKTTYFQTLPKDPISNLNYYYRTTLSGQGYLIFAYLENTQDQSIISSLSNLPTKACGSYNCNFAATSANTSPNASPDP
jgi:prepilin-type N-terminal cleavage/methylation domain-containing protein